MRNAAAVLETESPVCFLQPFGEVSCEVELQILQEHYRDYYFNHLPFNREATEPRTT